MDPFEMVVAIVAMALVAGIIKHFIESRQQTNVNESDENMQKMLQLQSQMEKRIRVLEEIVSSDQYDLKQQFKELE